MYNITRVTNNLVTKKIFSGTRKQCKYSYVAEILGLSPYISVN